MVQKLPSFYTMIKWDSQLRKLFLTKYISSENAFKRISLPEKWKITTGNRRYCTGYISEDEKFMSCSSSSTLDSKPSSNTTCIDCSSKHAFACRAFCKGEICTPSSSRVKEICDANITQVYLTLIGDKLKVGVSTNTMRRWLDQGSDYSVILWKGDGLIARRIENQIGRSSDIGMRVTFKEKIKALKNIKSKKEAKQILESKRENLNSNLDLSKTEEYSKEFFNLIQYQGKITNSVLSNVTPILQSIKEQTLIFGDLIAFKGSMLILQDAGTFYVYNLKQLLGWDLSNSNLKVKRKKKQSLIGYLKT